MSQARTDFLNRHKTLIGCLSSPIVQDGLPSEIEKNLMAAMFRNGLAVLAFSMMEAFIRDRTAEILKSFSNISVRFSDLSESLQTAVTINALKAVVFKAGLREKPDQIAWALGKLPTITTSSTNIASLSELSFGHTRSNLLPADVTEILGSFGIEGGWSAILSIAQRVGLGGVPDYSQAFKDIGKRRHSAAHDATTNIPINDLNDSANSIIAICCAFDLLISHSLSIHNTGKVPKKTTGLIKVESIGLRFISTHPKKAGHFREQVEKSKKLHTIKIHPSISAAEQACIAACSTNRQQLVQLGANSTPERWRTWP